MNSEPVKNDQQAWLDALVVGSEVMVYQFGNPKGVGTVERVTPTQLVVTVPSDMKYTRRARFTKRRGDEFGAGAYSGARIGPVSPEAIERMERRRILHRAADFPWSSLDAVELQALDVIMTSAKARFGK